MKATTLALALLLALPGLAAASPLSNARQLTFEGARAGEGYFSADRRRLEFQSERFPGNPFYHIHALDLETGDLARVSPGIGKTTCAWFHPAGDRVLFASTQFDLQAEAKMRAEIEFRASGQTRRYAWDYDPAYELVAADLATGGYTRLTEAQGYDAEGSYLPDGSRILFASNRHAYAAELTPDEAARLERDPSYAMDLYMMDADGTNLRRLTHAPGYDGGPFWSADGSRITWRRFSEDGARAEVYTMPADGGTERRITDLGVLSWAPFFHPSGDYLIFSTNLQGFDNFELYLVDPAGAGAPIRITEREGFDGLPSFSPDGRRLSWTSTATPDGKSQIFLADWDHEAALALLAGAGTDAAAAMLPGTAPGIATADLAAHVAALTADEMAGRLTGSAGAARAADYVAGIFEQIGLAPAGDDGTMFQAFDFTAGVALAEGNALGLSVDGAELAPELGTGWRPLAFSRAGAVAPAGVVFAGYGIVAPADGEAAAVDAYGELDVAGKWVLLWRGVPGDVAAERCAYLSRFADLRYKASVAKARGARGVIFAPPMREGVDDGLPALAYEAGAGVAGLPVVAVDRAMSGGPLGVLGDRLAPMVGRLEAGETAGANLIGVTASADIALEFETRAGRNVLARLDIDGVADGRPPLVIGADPDHLGCGETSGSLARADEAGAIHPGADDNASGVAALIEVAETLASQAGAGTLDASRDVNFAAWSGDFGLLGASHFVDALAAAAGKDDLAGLVSAYLNMDMVGRLDDRLIVSGLGSSPVWAREVERRNAVVGLPIVTSDDTYLPTDSTAFYLAGVPILALFTGAHGEYHTPRDTADRLNYQGVGEIARFAALVARSRLRDATEPDYVAVARPETSGARRMSAVFLGTIPDYAAEGRRGVAISGVVEGGPAAAAGLRGGDVSVGLAGQELDDIYDYVRTLNGLKPAETVEIAVERDGARLILDITPAARN